MKYRYLFVSEYGADGKPFLRPANLQDVRESTVLAEYECCIIGTEHLGHLKDLVERMDKSARRKQDAQIG